MLMEIQSNDVRYARNGRYEQYPCARAASVKITEWRHQSTSQYGILSGFWNLDCFTWNAIHFFGEYALYDRADFALMYLAEDAVHSCLVPLIAASTSALL